jgi:hypothetical protein
MEKKMAAMSGQPKINNLDRSEPPLVAIRIIETEEPLARPIQETGGLGGGKLAGCRKKQ